MQSPPSRPRPGSGRPGIVQSRIPRRIYASSTLRAQYDLELPLRQSPTQTAQKTPTQNSTQTLVNPDATLRPTETGFAHTLQHSSTLNLADTEEAVGPSALGSLPRVSRPRGGPGNDRLHRSDMEIRTTLGRTETPIPLHLPSSSQSDLPLSSRQSTFSSKQAPSSLYNKLSHSHFSELPVRGPFSLTLRQTTTLRRSGSDVSTLFVGLPRRLTASHGSSQSDPTSLHDGSRPLHVASSKRTIENYLTTEPNQSVEATTPPLSTFDSPISSVDLQDPLETSTPPGTPPTDFRAPINPVPSYQTSPISPSSAPLSTNSLYSHSNPSFTSHSSAFSSAPSSGFDALFTSPPSPHNEPIYYGLSSSSPLHEETVLFRPVSPLEHDGFKIFDESDPKQSAYTFKHRAVRERHELSARKERKRQLMPTHSRSKSESIIHPHLGAESHALLRQIDILNSIQFLNGHMGALDTEEETWISKVNTEPSLFDHIMLKSLEKRRRKERMKDLQDEDELRYGDGPEVRPTMGRRQKSERELNDHYWRMVVNEKEYEISQRVVRRVRSNVVGDGNLRWTR